MKAPNWVLILLSLVMEVVVAVEPMPLDREESSMSRTASCRWPTSLLDDWIAVNSSIMNLSPPFAGPIW